MVNSIDPVAISFGSIKVHWYGVLFASGLLSAYFLGEWMFKREGKDPKILDNFFSYLVIGIIVGARLFHVIFYDLNYFLEHPLEILFIWKGGLASHGGVIGAIIAIFLFCKKYSINFLWMLSRSALATLIVVTFIRIGNFVNSEIVGLPTSSIFGVVFERVDGLTRHPVVLYEAFGYFTIFIIFFIIYKRVSSEKFTAIAFPSILVLAFTLRFFLEYFKTPQSEFANTLPLSMGQILSIPFIIIGFSLLIVNLKRVKGT